MNSRALAIVLTLATVGCSATVRPAAEARADVMIEETGIDAARPETSVDVVARDVAPEAGSDAMTTPCSDLRCAPGEICVHQGFMEDGGFRECDRACLPAPSTSSGTCQTWGRDYCRLACYAVIDGAIYCLCD